MSPTFEDVISAVCSTFESLPIASDKKAYSIKDQKEAKLAFDILMAHGIEANLYNKDNGSAHLYVRLPTAKNAAQIPQALAYARSLKIVKQVMDGLNADTIARTTDYSINFVGSGHGKQITIHLAGIIPDTSNAPAEANPSSPVPSSIARSSNSTPIRTRDDFLQDFFGGPNVTRPTGRIKKQNYNQGPDGYGKQLKNYVKGNSAGALVLAAVGIFMLIFLYSIFQVSKGMLCPDFVVAEQEKNRSWYCK
jgi:hypothetical protein